MTNKHIFLINETTNRESLCKNQICLEDYASHGTSTLGAIMEEG